MAAPRKEVKMVPSINWEIESKQIAVLGEDEAIPGYHALKRNDTGATISVFKKSYVFYPNADFVATAQKLSDVTGYPIEGFQEINGGKRVLAYLKNTNKDFKLVGQDLDDYLVLGNSHDGSTSLFLGNSSTIIRCMNQFGAIIQNMKYRHTRGMEEKMLDITQEIENYFVGVKRLSNTFERMREIKIDKQIIEALALRLFDVDNVTDMKPTQLVKINDFKASAEREIDELGANMWGLFNGVTHYTTHKVTSKNPTLGNFWGQSGDINRKALLFGNEMIEGKRPALITV